jgi:hypothetical protein
MTGSGATVSVTFRFQISASVEVAFENGNMVICGNDPVNRHDALGLYVMEMLPEWLRGPLSNAMPGLAMADHTVDVTRTSKAVYQTIRSQGGGAGAASYGAVGYALGDLTGVLAIHDSVSGDRITLNPQGCVGITDLTKTERVVSGVTGSIQLVGTAFGVKAVGGKIAGAPRSALSPTTTVEPPPLPTAVERIGDVPYNSRSIRVALEERYGASNVASTTIPPSSGSNVWRAGQKHPSGIVFDAKGLAIFDDVAVFDTKLAADAFRSASYRGQMRMATRDLRAAISRGEINPGRFTELQLRQIRGGASKIDDFTWHHHQDIGRMQLVPEDLHELTGHIGGSMGGGL